MIESRVEDHNLDIDLGWSMALTIVGGVMMIGSGTLALLKLRSGKHLFAAI